MKIRNVSPLGDLDVPLLRRSIAAGEVVDIPDEHAQLLAQFENFAPADKAAEKAADAFHAEQSERERVALGIPDESDRKAEWVEYAEAQGDEDAAHKTKAELVDEYGSE
jgi:hypothetical protein